MSGARARSDTAAARPRSRPMSTRVIPIVPKTAWAVRERDDDGPAGGAEERAVAGAGCRRRVRWTRPIAQALERDRGADRQPVGRGQPLGDEGRRLGAGARGRPADRGQVVERAGRRGSMPRTVTGGCGRRARARSARGTSGARCRGAATATPGVPGSSPTVASARPASPKAETRRSARPTRSRTVRSTDGVDAGVGRQRREQDADAEGDAEGSVSAGGRSGRAREAGQPGHGAVRGAIRPTGRAGRAGR